ncbi:MAG: hypothetical protein Nkreftii_000318 [Candidatus Nitrospira kreftii]|uniref:Lipoprotein n=1 Tax=Candidatus Nitrospira kreftii TaxID=2652173 RepID=A0A7S8FB62_9BACT|nr:MAG: hypothetical protein Nkreftii_000318 [Candidatus Nitrospira kreftii]
MKKIQVGTWLLGIVCLSGAVGCASGKAAMHPVSEHSPVSGTTETVSAAPTDTPPDTLADSLHVCLARIPSDSSNGAKMVAEQSCQDNEDLRQGVVGTAIAKSGGRASAGTQGDSLESCVARIPEDATAGQRMMAEETCARDQSTHR